MQWLDFQNPVLPNRTTRIPSGHQPHLRGGVPFVLRRVSRNLRTVYANAFEGRIYIHITTRTFIFILVILYVEYLSFSIGFAVNKVSVRMRKDYLPS